MKWNSSGYPSRGEVNKTRAILLSVLLFISFFSGCIPALISTQSTIPEKVAKNPLAKTNLSVQPSIRAEQQINGPILLSAATGGESEIENFTILIDGALLYSTGTYPYEYLWNSSSVKPGKHILSFIIEDQEGNEALSDVPVRILPSQAEPTETSQPVIVDPSDTPSPTPTMTATPTPRPVTEAIVLWDVSHEPRRGQDGAYAPNGVFSDLRDLLKKENIYLNEGENSIFVTDLSMYRLVVISATSCYKKPFTTDEIQSLVNYVDSGGSLLVLGEVAGFPNQIALVPESFGVKVAQGDELWNVTRFNDHPIFDGVSELYFYQGGSLAISGDANVIANAGGLAAIVEVSGLSGRVIVIGDSNFLDDRWLGLSDNAQMAVNLFRWLVDMQ